MADNLHPSTICWHNLRQDPFDLPDDFEKVCITTLYEEEKTVIFGTSFKNGKWYNADMTELNLRDTERITAWAQVFAYKGN